MVVDDLLWIAQNHCASSDEVGALIMARMLLIVKAIKSWMYKATVGRRSKRAETETENVKLLRRFV